MTGPIYSVIQILREAIQAALDPLTTAGVYWAEADQDAGLPVVIGQSQDNGGADVSYVGAFDWSGLVAIRCLAAALPTAETLLASIAPGMETLSHAGVTITTRPIQPLTIPPFEGVYQAGRIWRIRMSAA
jgi:hypothetical protein